MRKGLIGLLALGLVGCHAAYQPLPASDRVDLQVLPTLEGRYGLQAEVKRKTAGDIHRLDIVPYVEVASSIFQPLSSTGEPTTPSDPSLIKLSQATPSIDFDRPVTLRNLKAMTRYRIFAQAYDGQGTLISTSNAMSYVEVAVGANDRPTLPVRLPVRLLDTPFAARTTVSVDVSGARNRVDEVTASLFMLVNGTEVPLATPLTVTKAALPRVVSLGGLQAETTYRVRVKAMDLSDGVLASGSVDVPVGTDDAPASRAMSLPILEFPLSARIGF